MSGKRRECPSCATEIPANQEVCYICGYEFPSRGGSYPGWVKWVALIVALLFLAPLVRVLLR